MGDNANKLHKQAFIHAWKEVYGIDTHVDVIQHHGNTDPLILIRVLEYHGIAKSDVSVWCVKVNLPRAVSCVCFAADRADNNN